MPEHYIEKKYMPLLESFECSPTDLNDYEDTISYEMSPGLNSNLYLNMDESEDEDSNLEDFLEDFEDAENINFQAETTRLSRIQHLKPLDDDSMDESESESYHEELSYNGKLFDSDNEEESICEE